MVRGICCHHQIHEIPVNLTGKAGAYYALVRESDVARTSYQYPGYG